MKIIALIAIITTLLLCLTAIANAQTTPTLTATPNNSNIFKVTGQGFTPDEIVNLTLHNETAIVFNFANLTADSTGSINGTEIIPTSIPGANYNITATGLTSNVTVTVVNYAVPNLTGATGPRGATGDTGDTGATGQAANMTISYVAVFLSLIAIVIAVITFIKRKAVESPPPPPTSPPQTSPNPSRDIAVRLQKLKALLNSGAISRDDYERRKREILSQL
jgi:hypothetical protein